MNKKHMRQQFISGFLVVLSVTSMALLWLQFLTATLGSPAPTMNALNFDSRLAGMGFYWWTDIVQGLLLLTLVIIALISLFSLRLSRRSEEHPALEKKPAHDVVRADGFITEVRYPA